MSRGFMVAATVKILGAVVVVLVAVGVSCAKVVPYLEYSRAHDFG